MLYRSIRMDGLLLLSSSSLCDVKMGDEVPYLSKYLRLLNDAYVQSLGR